MLLSPTEEINHGSNLVQIASPAPYIISREDIYACVRAREENDTPTTTEGPVVNYLNNSSNAVASFPLPRQGQTTAFAPQTSDAPLIPLPIAHSDDSTSHSVVPSDAPILQYVSKASTHPEGDFLYPALPSQYLVTRSESWRNSEEEDDEEFLSPATQIMPPDKPFLPLFSLSEQERLQQQAEEETIRGIIRDKEEKERQIKMDEELARRLAAGEEEEEGRPRHTEGNSGASESHIQEEEEEKNRQQISMDEELAKRLAAEEEEQVATARSVQASGRQLLSGYAYSPSFSPPSGFHHYLPGTRLVSYTTPPPVMGHNYQGVCCYPNTSSNLLAPVSSCRMGVLPPMTRCGVSRAANTAHGTAGVMDLSLVASEPVEFDVVRVSETPFILEVRDPRGNLAFTAKRIAPLMGTTLQVFTAHTNEPICYLRKEWPQRKIRWHIRCPNRKGKDFAHLVDYKSPRRGCTPSGVRYPAKHSVLRYNAGKRRAMPQCSLIQVQIPVSSTPGSTTRYRKAHQLVTTGGTVLGQVEQMGAVPEKSTMRVKVSPGADMGTIVALGIMLLAEAKPPSFSYKSMQY